MPAKVKHDGPIALDTMVHADAAIDIFNIWRRGKHILRLLEAPYQELRSWITDGIAQGYFRQAATKRKDLNGETGFDRRATIAGAPRMRDEDYPCWVTMICGGLWTAQRKHKAGLADAGDCPFCGKQTEDLKHIFLCEANPAKKDEASDILECAREGHIPQALFTHGIAPPLVTDGHDGAYWAQHGGVSARLPASVRGPTPNGKQHLAIYGASGYGPDERELCEVMRQAKGVTAIIPPVEMPAIEPRDGEVHEVYTDGSMTHPLWPQYGLAGGAAMELRRRVPQAEEDQFAEVTAGEHELVKRLTLQGGGLSSTRAEIAPALCALQTPTHYVLRTDSKAVVRGHRRVAKALAGVKGVWFCKMRNGDMWKRYSDALERRGCHTAHVRWLKGHAGAEHERYGMTREQAEANDKVDDFADQAVKTHDEALQNMSDYAVARHTGYLAFVKRIRTYQLDVVRHLFKITPETRSRAKERGTMNEVYIKPLGYADEDAANHLPLRHALLLPQRSEGAQVQTKIAQYLANTKWTSVREGQQGISWHEMLIDFEAHSAFQVKAKSKSPHCLDTLHDVLAAFKKLVKQSIRTQFRDEVGVMFEPNKTRTARLSDMGIHTVVACVKALPALSEERVHRLTHGLVKMRGIHDQDSLDKLARGELRVPPKKLAAGLRPMWRAGDGHIPPEGEKFPWIIECMTCKHNHTLDDRPARIVTGWPRKQCPACGTTARVGGCRCMGCLSPVAKCRCPQGKVQGKPEERKTHLLRLLSARVVGQP